MSFLFARFLSAFAVLLVLAPAIASQQIDEELPFETVVKYTSNGPRLNLQTIVTGRRAWKKLWKRRIRTSNRYRRCQRWISLNE
jgi:hypothetical protein